MAKKLQILRGTTAQNDAYTGSIGELTMDTEKVEVRIHDGTTQGGKTIGSGGGASLPILTHVFSDHKLNDISWLNADTFSWQSGDVYVAAYNHLANDYNSLPTGVLYAYYAENAGETFYLRTDTPSVGDQLLDETGTPAYEAYGEHKVKEIYDDGSFARTATFPGNRFYRDASKDITLSTPKSETETVDDITITFYRAEDGHKICLADQEANVQRLYDWMGVAWYYVLDTANKQFKLPRTKHAFTGLRDSVGGYVKAGLPNITGEIYAGGTYGFSAFTSANGAFKSGTHTGWRATTQQQNVAGATENVYIDASRSSSVYGNSNTVQPEATQMYLYFYVGNFERNAVEQTAGITSEMFNNKADVSRVQELENTTTELENKTRHVVVEFQEPTSSNNNTWYRIYNDGWVEQGGTVKGTWEIGVGEEKIPSVTVPIPVNRYNAHAFFSTKEVYCFPMGYYWENDSTIRARFGAYQVKRTLSEFKYVVYGMRA